MTVDLDPAGRIQTETCRRKRSLVKAPSIYTLTFFFQ